MDEGPHATLIFLGRCFLAFVRVAGDWYNRRQLAELLKKPRRKR